MRFLRSVSILTAILGLGLVAPATAQDDTVNMHDGTKKTGKVEVYDFRTIKLTSQNGKISTNIKVEDAKSVEWGGKPKAFKEAESALAAGNDEDAATKLQAIIDDAKLRDVLKQEAYFLQAAAYANAGKNAEAADSLQKMLAKFPQSHYIVAAHEMAVRALLAAGKAADAVSFTQAEETRVGAIPDSRALTDGLKLLRCRVQLASNQGPQAKADLQTLANTAGPMAEQAKVMLGEVLLAENNVAEAEKLFRDALKSTKAAQVRAGAYNGLGEINFKKGYDGKKSDLLKDALFSYLRTVVQFPPAAGDSSEYHEAAIFKAGCCFQALGDLEKDKDAQGRLFARSRELFKRLLNDYKGSTLAGEAQTRLERMQ